MTTDEYRAYRDSIMAASDCTEVNYKPKLEDEYGVQYPVAKSQYVSSVGVVTTEYTYEGDTRNFRVVSINEYITIDGIITNEPRMGV